MRVAIDIDGVLRDFTTGSSRVTRRVSASQGRGDHRMGDTQVLPHRGGKLRLCVQATCRGDIHHGERVPGRASVPWTITKSCRPSAGTRARVPAGRRHSARPRRPRRRANRAACGGERPPLRARPRRLVERGQIIGKRRTAERGHGERERECGNRK